MIGGFFGGTMDIKEDELRSILVEIIEEDCEDVDSIAWRGASYIIDIWKGESQELVDKVLMKKSTDKTLRIIK